MVMTAKTPNKAYSGYRPKEPNGPDERTTHSVIIQRKTPKGKSKSLLLLRQTSSVLLEMPLRFFHLPELHGEKFLGDVL
jgi:hypothetical protein